MASNIVTNGSIISMPSNIYEELLLRLAPLIQDISSCVYINDTNGFGYDDYKDTLTDLSQERSFRGVSLNFFSDHVDDYFECMFRRMIDNSAILNVDNHYGVPMHKVFECFVAAIFAGNVVGGRNDHGVDVRVPNKNFIIQCKLGASHVARAKQTYERLITSCIDEGVRCGILVVTDSTYPNIQKYEASNARANDAGLSIQLLIWTDSDDIWEYSSGYNESDDDADQAKWKSKFLSRFLNQIHASIGRARRTMWDDILSRCITVLENLPIKYDEAIESIDAA